MKAIRNNANPKDFTKNAKRLEETIVDIIESTDDKNQMIQQVNMAFEDVIMVMMNKNLKKIQRECPR